MKKITIIESSVIPLNREDIDTDQIIPARFLKATTRKNFGDNLFRDWRYDKNNTPIPSFVLNDSTWSGKILVTGKNFGCGSSREHAAWAIYDYGIRAVVSSFFADIFKSNALNNGLLPIQVSPLFLEKLFLTVSKSPKAMVAINLRSQTITILSTNDSESFNISAYKKNCLINGLDDINFLLSKQKEIIAYEKKKAFHY